MLNFLIQWLLERLYLIKDSSRIPYWYSSGKPYCAFCKYSCEICMHGENPEDLKDKNPCAKAYCKMNKETGRLINKKPF